MAKTKKYTYNQHYKPHAEGHIFIKKEGACTVTLTGAASMTQKELDELGEKIVDLLNKS